MEQQSTNIFYKIFQIMDHYENILENLSYKGDKYKPDDTFNDFMKSDEFFSSIFKEVPINKKEVPPEADPENDEPPPPSEKTSPDQDESPPDEPILISHRELIVNKYIKKCYRVIVLKCHPDKNKTHENDNDIFIKCQQYYDCDFLIGLLYVFYLYKLKPPAPLDNTTQNESDDDYTTIVNRILLEMRVIQDKLIQINTPIPPDANND